MIGAMQQDPAAAVILYCSPDDIETVFFNGLIRMNSRRLKTLNICDGREVSQVNMVDAQEGVMNAFHIDTNLLAE